MVIRRVDKNFKLVFLFYTLFIFFVFSVLKILAAPDTPTNSTPADSATGVSVTPTLTSSAYSNGRDSVTISDGIVDRINNYNYSGSNMESGDINATTPGGISSSSILFDGSDELLSATNKGFMYETASGGRSLSFWFRPNSVPATGTNSYGGAMFRVIGEDGTYLGYMSFGVRARSSPSISARIDITARGQSNTINNTDGYYGSTTITTGTWYHVVFTTSGSVWRVFINGSEETMTEWAGPLANDGEWFRDLITSGNMTSYIGSTGPASVYYDGYIDEITIWGTTLDPSEVSELYNSGAPIDPTSHSESANLTVYWPLGEELEHAASQWQITSTSGDYSTPVYDSGTDTTNLTSITVPGGSALSEGTTYYWRVRHQDEQGDWSSWSTETSFTTESSGTLSVDIVDSGGTTVPSPSVSMNSTTFSFSDQTTTGTFGISSEKIRVDNGTGTDTWTLSVAASSTTSLWDSAGTDYDFNDPTASAGDGGDADSVGGQMTIDPTSITITPEGGCTSTNISAGSSSAFSEGVTDSITIASAASGADTGCYWDITGVDISQTIPAEQPAASDYNIDMVLSIVAS